MTAAVSARRAPAPTRTAGAGMAVDQQVEQVLAWLERHATRRTLDGMARYAIPATTAFGVAMADIQKLGKQLGRNHELAVALWATDRYEARTLTAFIAEPERVTSAQMDRWCRDFDSWAICDSLCFYLFDRTPHAWHKVATWSNRRDEIGKRAAFALLASLAAHDKTAADSRFLDGLRRIEKAASDDRNFVKKGVSWALRMIGRRNPALNAAALVVARRLAASTEAAPCWVGRGAVKELTSPAVVKKLTAAKPAPRGRRSPRRAVAGRAAAR